MPYKKFTKKREGKMMFCMMSEDSGKTYCYHSKAEREKGQRIHEAFKHGFKMTQKK